MTTIATPLMECRGCGATDLEMFVSLGKQPLANHLTSREALDQPDAHFPLELVRCGHCGLVQLSVTIPPDAMFSEYLYFSSFAGALVENARGLVERIVSERGFGPDDLAMEIGSNDGYLLRHYVDRGVPVLGVDPARNVAAVAEQAGVRTHVAFFGSDTAANLASEGFKASVVHANNVIAHVPDILDVLAGVTQILRPNGIFVVETPSLQTMFETLAFDTIYHEHVFVHSLTNFSSLLSKVGLEVIDVELIPVHGTSLRITAAHPGRQEPTSRVAAQLTSELDSGLGDPETYRTFGKNTDAIRTSIIATLQDLKRDGATIAGYGAAAKCTVLLNSLGVSGRLPIWVADANPHKQGRCIPGVRVPVVSPDRILEEQPDVMVLFVWNLLDEVLKQNAEYRSRGGRFLIPIPAPKVV
ncbi:class I SAM-dependent methyltransferase [Thiocapsa rosea]|uniref:Methyltransferase family protein n=1 Tax=Thiocapsa rosea TaxID=69360 RepID=A0A495VDJ4_9GAMM|nr:class I SAM-dependent methyltransferase [Thiocapsa rosea]RKT47471.1 methyltransferase family protein [Thiocapsa rosea]